MSLRRYLTSYIKKSILLIIIGKVFELNMLVDFRSKIFHFSLTNDDDVVYYAIGLKKSTSIFL